MNWEQANRNLDERRQKALMGGGQSKIDKQHAGGKLTARERLELLFDQGALWKRTLLSNPGLMILIWIKEGCRGTAW